MDLKTTKNKLSELFKIKYNDSPEQIIMLPSSGSDRIYFRITNKSLKAIGAYNSDIQENEAFFSFSSTFRLLNIQVPEILEISDDRKHYLLTDLGDQTLFQLISLNKRTEMGNSLLCLIKESLYNLIKVQLQGGDAIDFSKCYPRAAFDKQSIHWDLNYFKYEFLKLAGIPFNEQNLETDFNTLVDFLLKAPSTYFMFRDFQSRNIMIIDDSPWFIDYQGGRKGPLQYDVASLLYSPKTKLNNTQKEVLLDFYLNHLEKQIEVDRIAFKEYYYGFVLIRILQALGAYGFRGLYEKKVNFRNSIPAAISNLNHLFRHNLIAVNLPQIQKIVSSLSISKWAEPYVLDESILTINVTSFSYKKGIPDDLSENGGGFVFDCRGLPNPGRFKKYQSLSGLDNEVIEYFSQFPELDQFQKLVQQLLSISIKEYLQRGFNHLCVNFGCTGGQHRSVYNAEKFCAWIENNFPVKVVLIHKEKDNWKKDE